MKEIHRTRPVLTEADRERRAREWADRLPEDEREAAPARETYPDGSLISECWRDGVSSARTEEE